jgi:hypothetical protein
MRILIFQCSMNIRVVQCGRAVIGKATHLHIMSRLRMCGSLPPFQQDISNFLQIMFLCVRACGTAPLHLHSAF